MKWVISGTLLGHTVAALHFWSRWSCRKGDRRTFVFQCVSLRRFSPLRKGLFDRPLGTLMLHEWVSVAGVFSQQSLSSRSVFTHRLATFFLHVLFFSWLLKCGAIVSYIFSFAYISQLYLLEILWKLLFKRFTAVVRPCFGIYNLKAVVACISF